MRLGIAEKSRRLIINVFAEDPTIRNAIPFL